MVCPLHSSDQSLESSQTWNQLQIRMARLINLIPLLTFNRKIIMTMLLNQVILFVVFPILFIPLSPAYTLSRSFSQPHNHFLITSFNLFPSRTSTNTLGRLGSSHRGYSLLLGHLLESPLSWHLA